MKIWANENAEKVVFSAIVDTNVKFSFILEPSNVSNMMVVEIKKCSAILKQGNLYKGFFYVGSNFRL